MWIYGGFRSHRGTPKNHPLMGNKPSSYGGTPIFKHGRGDAPFLSHQKRLKLLESRWKVWRSNDVKHGTINGGAQNRFIRENHKIIKIPSFEMDDWGCPYDETETTETTISNNPSIS